MKLIGIVLIIAGAFLIGAFAGTQSAAYGYGLASLGAFWWICSR